MARVASAMDVAHRQAEEGAPAGSLVLADEQTAGRGRAGRAWHSPPGAGIWLAMVLRPQQPPPGGVLAIRVGLAVHAALAAALPSLKADLKWPNDIVVTGRKLGGILCEARWTGDQFGWIVAGIGLNVFGPLAPGLEESAITAAELAPDATRLGILEATLSRVAAAGSAGGLLNGGERERYLASLWMPRGSEPVLGLDPDGALLVRTATGATERRIEAA